MSYYRTFLNRYNHIDANVPGNDYQFPVSIEGVLGYNNAIQLTQPMHLQDLKYFRDPLYSYGNWVSSGETSKCTAFTSNPGSFSWGNTYEQYIAREAFNAYKVHGGDRGRPGQLRPATPSATSRASWPSTTGNGNSLIEYNSGALTGNDADAVALQYYSSASQDRAETAFWYSGAQAAADAYTLLGNTAKAAEMNAIADNIRTAILTKLWDDDPQPTRCPRRPADPACRAGQIGNAVRPQRLPPQPERHAAGRHRQHGLNDFTVATWVNLAATHTWSRVFDFGSGPTTNMFLTVNAGTGPRFALTTGGGGNRAAHQPHHGRTAAARTSGSTWPSRCRATPARSTSTAQPVGTNTTMTLRPSSMGDTTQNWIGKSQYGDPGLNGTVDDFHIYDRALSARGDRRRSATAPGGGHVVVRYRFDEAERRRPRSTPPATGATPRVDTPLVGHPGKVFKQRNVARDALVPWKDQQNFSPFTEGLVPNTDEYKQALRFYADRREFPIMPFYTANQRDKAEAAATGQRTTSRTSTRRCRRSCTRRRCASTRRRTSPRTCTGCCSSGSPGSQYVGGDNRFPDNNEFFFNWNPATRTLGRSGIHHNILGAYNFMIIDDIAGVRPRLDDVLELWPIDVG